MNCVLNDLKCIFGISVLIDNIDIDTSSFEIGHKYWKCRSIIRALLSTWEHNCSWVQSSLDEDVNTVCLSAFKLYFPPAEDWNTHKTSVSSQALWGGNSYSSSQTFDYCQGRTLFCETRVDGRDRCAKGTRSEGLGHMKYLTPFKSRL